tara:strand:- start:257 stop:700 length:444 start_codon:yes stop_codon:yes gene_type:complete
MENALDFNVTVKFTSGMTDKKRTGRPPSNLPTRDKQVAFYLTPEDAEWFSDFAKSYGFKSRGEALSAFAERIRLCGASPVGMFRIGTQIARRCKEVNPLEYEQGGFDFNSLALRPLPALPDVDLTPDEVSKSLAELTAEFRNERLPS